MADTDLYDLFTAKEGVTEGTFTTPGAWSCDYEYDSWTTPVDLTSYSKLVANLTADKDVKVKIMVQFAQEEGNITDEGNLFTLKAGEAKDVYVELAKTVAEGVRVNQIYMQADLADVKFTVNSYKFISKTAEPTYGEEKNLAMDEYGNILAAEFEGYSDDAVVTFTYCVTTEKGDATKFAGWGYGQVSSINKYNKANDGDEVVDVDNIEALAFTKSVEGNNYVTCKLSVLKAALAAPADKNGRQGIYWNAWGQKDPWNAETDLEIINQTTVARVSVTIKDVVKDTEPEALKPALENAELVGTEYFSLTGVKSATPQKGINIIRRSFSNGSVQLEKALVK